MSLVKVFGAIAGGITADKCERRPIRKAFVHKSSKWILQSNFLDANQRERLICNNAAQNFGLVSDQDSSNYELGSSDVDKQFASIRKRLDNESIKAHM